MISDIATGHTELADFLFLLAFILACVGVVISLTVRPIHVQWLIALGAGACAALAFFVL